MVYRMEGLGAAAPETSADAKTRRRAVQTARDEWKVYLSSLRNLNSGLRRGTLPPDQPLPSPPSNPPEMVPDLFREAKRMLEVTLPTAYTIAGNLARAQVNRAATSSYAAGQPPVAPEGGLTTTQVPRGDLPGQVQQVITDASGASPVLQQDMGPQGASSPQGNFIDTGPQGAAGPYTGAYVDPGAQPQEIYLEGQVPELIETKPSPMKKILVVAAVGVALFLAYRWWKKRK